MIETTDTKTILVIDDSSLDRLRIRIALEKTCRVIEAQSAADAREKLAQTTPELILLDILMPKENGFQFFAWMKKEPQLSEIPVIFLTCDDDPETETQCIQTGAQDFIKKPVVHSVLCSRVFRILELDSYRRQLEKEVKKQTALAKQRLLQYENLTRSTIDALVQVLDMKTESPGRTRRIAATATAIALRLQKTPAEIENIYYAAVLHDIGKILTAGSAEKPADHTETGCKILSSVPYLEQFASCARSHHECFDGTGFPDRLRGKNIPETARILAAANAYESMSHPMRGTSPLEPAAICSKIQNEKGTRFDPVIADALLEVITETEMRG